jgi:hypothetical protein
MHRHTSRVVHLDRRARAIGLALWLAACGGAAKPTATSDTVQRRSNRADGENKPFGAIALDPNAEAVQVDCDSGAYEQCNALDDDCNGVIDDECGYESGAVQITLSWNTGADIDLYVTDPSGTTLYYNEHHSRSRIGGHLDHNARGSCRREQQNPRIENAYWPDPHPGRYKIALHYFSPCDGGGSTVATLSAMVRGELVGSFRYHLEPEQHIDALSFEVY